MKSKLSFLGSLLTCLFLTFGAKAIVLFQDNFPYGNGPIDIVSGGNGTGGGGVWVSGAGSTYGTTDDIICDGFGDLEITGSGPSILPKAYWTNGFAGSTFAAVPLFTNTVYYFLSNAPVAGLYASFYLNVDPNAFATNKFGSGSPYFAYFSDTNFDFAPRIFVTTNGAATGNYRVSVGGGTTTAGIFPMDLFTGQAYQVVVRYTISTGTAELWINPANETDAGASPTGTLSLNGISTPDTSGVVTTNNFGTCAFGVRNAGNDGPLYISQLIIGTTFADVVPASDGQNPVFIQTQPQSVTNFAGQAATLSVVAGGDADTMTYQWNYNGSPLPGATTSSISFSSLVGADAGTYNVTVANAATPSGVTSATVNLSVLATDIVPTIVSGPTNLAASAGTTATFTVNATDAGAPLAYQWYLGGTPIASQTNSTLAINSVAISNAATTYMVQVTNPNGDVVSSSNASLTVGPPIAIKATIQYVRSLLDTNYNTNANYVSSGALKLFTITGTNTVWENLTTSGNSEFYIEDATAGITVFWSGAAAATHMPPAGAVVTVTAPVSDFDGLLEIEPVFTNTFHSVTWTNVGALPRPLPLPFDPNITGNPNYMQKHLVGEYFGATNVFLENPGTLYGNNANEPLTNDEPGSVAFSYNFFNASNPTNGTTTVVQATNVNGQIFNVIFYSDHTDIFGAVKPVGPVTIYGVLGIFDSTLPYTNGYELTPSRLADIVPAVSITNVISNVIRHGDLATNSFSATVLQPGETLTMTVVAQDPGGGTATISSLGGNGTWSTITGNGTSKATATYRYTGTVAEEGTADTPSLTASFTSSGFVGAYTNLNTIYVPNPGEQNIRISELLSSPTSNTNSPAYDPLNRPKPETGTIAVNDQYVELVNANSSGSQNINRWTLWSGFTQVYTFVLGETLPAHTCGVVYGGPTGTDTDPPELNTDTLEFNENSGSGLALSTSGGTFSLYNTSGYLIDRVAYPPIGALTNSFSRFFTMNGQLVPQSWINTNVVTPGYQYNNGSWASNTVPPVGVAVHLTYGNPVQLNFTATPGNVSTLWQANTLFDYFNVVNGQTFTTTSGSFSVTNPPPASQFYFITTP